MGRVHEGPEPSDSPELSEYKEQCKVSVNQLAHRWTLVLKAQKIDEVHVIYGAGEDDGGIEEVKYFRREAGTLVQIDEPPELTKTAGYGNSTWKGSVIEGFMYNLMQARGFFNQNEGCQGVIRWSIENDTLIHDHVVNSYGEGDEIANPGDPEEDQYTETTYIPGEVETYYGVDDVAYRVEP